MFNNFNLKNNSKTSNETLSNTFNIDCCKVCDEADQSQKTDKIFVCLCRLSYNNYQSYSLSDVQSMKLEHPAHLSNYINKCRRWAQIIKPNQVKGNLLTKFTITSYNILAQNLLLNNLFLYKGHPRSHLVWSKRAERLKDELVKLNSDIYCLQEVHMNHFENDILPSFLQRGYQLVFKQRTGVNLDGCSILFKKNKFHLQDLMLVEFNQPEVSRLLNRDNVAVFVKLKPKLKECNNDLSIIVVNTHLLFNPKRGDIKLAQVRLLLAKLQRFSLKDKCNSEIYHPSNYHPIIFCGDMNSQPNSLLINFIQNGLIDLTNQKSGDISGQKDGVDVGHLLTERHLQMATIDGNCCFNEMNDKAMNNVEAKNNNDYQSFKIRHLFNFKSVYPDTDEQNLKLISTLNVTDSSLVDYIFYQNHPNLILSSYLRLMNHHSVNRIPKIPNSILGSDHFALSAEFYVVK